MGRSSRYQLWETLSETLILGTLLEAASESHPETATAIAITPKTLAALRLLKIPFMTCSFPEGS